MASPTKLTSDQRAALLMWLAADYDSRLIKKWFRERGWPELSDRLITYYRHSRDEGIARLRQRRRDSALETGLALKEERVARLKEHADELEAIKWDPDDKGRLWNEKAWRETLEDIAAEMGHRKATVEIRDWRDRIIDLLKSGSVTPEQVREELGNDIATELINAAGMGTGEGRKDREGSGEGGAPQNCVAQ